MQDKIKKGLSPEEKRQLQLLRQLSVTEEFKLWRDIVVKPVLDEIDERLADPLELEEVELKAVLLMRNMIKGKFYMLFDNVEVQLKIEKQ